MSIVNQVIAAARPGDAVTDQAFAWRRLLAGWGISGRVVAEHVDQRLADEVPRLDASRHLLRGEDVVLHYSVWSDEIADALGEWNQVALYYHNITPGELLRPFNPVLADYCDRGREQLADLRGRVGPVLAASNFNARDLRQAGLGEATVVPLLIDMPAHVARRPPAGDPIVLTVGRIAPNKRLEDVIKAFTLFQRHRSPTASLVVVGTDDGFESYRQALDLLVASLGTGRVAFTGPVSPEARDAWYRRADVYLSLSAHEGFCAPLIEAIAHGVPVVTRSAGAQPETIGDAGIVLDGRDLPLVAEALNELTTSEQTREALADAAERRLADLRPETVAPRLRAALEPMLNGR